MTTPQTPTARSRYGDDPAFRRASLTARRRSFLIRSRSVQQDHPGAGQAISTPTRTAGVATWPSSLFAQRPRECFSCCREVGKPEGGNCGDGVWGALSAPHQDTEGRACGKRVRPSGVTWGKGNSLRQPGRGGILTVGFAPEGCANRLTCVRLRRLV